MCARFAATGLLCLGLLLTPASTPHAAADSCDPAKTQYVAEMPPALERLDAERVWRIATGKGVVVAVVDDGLNVRNAHFPEGSYRAGVSLAGGSPTSPGDLGHGTAIAGQIAARRLPVTATRRSGVVGLAKGAVILPVRVVAPDAQDERINPAVLARGIRYAADHGAKVINVSASVPTDVAALRDAVRHATSRGALVVASGGNRNTAEDQTDSPRYPGAYPEALAVAATDSSDTVTDDSIHGPHIDIAAPGDQVLTAYVAAGDCILAGKEQSTSYATAYVSAAAALLAQRFPSEGPPGWKYRLEATASRPQRDARDDLAGWGLVQPYEALTFTLDGSVAGPVAPGSTATPASTPPVERVALGPMPDPLAGDRRTALWLGLAGATLLLGLALLRMLRSHTHPHSRG